MLDLPSDIVRDDILSRLDAKTIISCKCVCKAWRNLISDQSFAPAHLTRSRPAVVFQQSSDYILACCMDDRRNAVATFASTAPNRRYPQPREWLVGSCNGLLLLRRYWRSLFICNPLLGEFIRLPPLTCEGFGSFGFGFSPRTNQYKVIHVCGRARNVGNPEAEVHTVGADHTWRSIGKVPFPLLGQASYVQLNGALHWLVDVYDNHHGFRQEICSFDVGNERVQRIAPPPQLSGSLGLDIIGFGLGVFDNSLCLCQVSANQVCLWLMSIGEIQGSWTRKFMLETQIPFRFGMHLSPLTTFEDGEVLMKVERRSLLVFNPTTRRFRELELKVVEHFSSAFLYVPSFISPGKLWSERRMQEAPFAIE